MTTHIYKKSPISNRNCKLSEIAPTSELLDFLELSIGEKTDTYLQQLALLAASTQGITTTKEKKPITGTVTVHKFVLLPIHHWTGSEFTVTINAMSYPLPWWRNSDKEFPGKVIFWNPELDAEGTFSLSFSEIQQEFKVNPSMLHLHQEFDAKVLAIGYKFVELRLVEKFSKN